VSQADFSPEPVEPEPAAELDPDVHSAAAAVEAAEPGAVPAAELAPVPELAAPKRSRAKAKAAAATTMQEPPPAADDALLPGGPVAASPAGEEPA
jgi:hypothetical protein